MSDERFILLVGQDPEYVGPVSIATAERVFDRLDASGRDDVAIRRLVPLREWEHGIGIGEGR